MTNPTHTAVHIPDEAVQAGALALRYSGSDTLTDTAKTVLTAAIPYLSAPCAVEVKKLEWVEVSYGFIAHTAFGTYKLSLNWGDHCKTAMVIAGGEIPKSFHAEADEAKEAAQADFERRILSCVVTKPVDVAAVLTRTPAIEALTPTNDEWKRCVSIQDTYDLMKRKVAASFRALSAEPAQGDTAAARDVLAERRRQIESKGFDASHDDINTRGQIATAAGCYILHNTHLGDELEIIWPWDFSWWKPTNRRRDLVKAGALILAEIERLDRAAPTTEAGNDTR